MFLKEEIIEGAVPYRLAVSALPETGVGVH